MPTHIEKSLTTSWEVEKLWRDAQSLKKKTFTFKVNFSPYQISKDILFWRGKFHKRTTNSPVWAEHWWYVLMTESTIRLPLEKCCPVVWVDCTAFFKQGIFLRARWSVFMIKTAWNRLLGVNKCTFLPLRYELSKQSPRVIESPFSPGQVDDPSIYCIATVAYIAPSLFSFLLSLLLSVPFLSLGECLFVFIVIKLLMFSHHPFIHPSLRLCHCLLIERLYIYYSFDWLPLIASQVEGINHCRNPIICIPFGEFWWCRFGSVALAREASLERCEPKREQRKATLLTAKKINEAGYSTLVFCFYGGP